MRDPAAAFLTQVHDALAHLYDPVALQTHPLAQQLSQGDSRVPPSHAGNALRQRLLDAIATLRPGTKTSETSPSWRPYRLLELRYVEALEPAAVQDQLGISKSQYYRDHTRALEALVLGFAELWRRASPQDHAGAQATEAPPRPAPSRPSTASGRLPRPLTSFVGRERELREIAALLAQVRLLTLTGPGGSGKTRLALAAAAEAADQYPDGVYFVDLAPLRDPGLVLPTIAHTLDAREGGGRASRELLARFIQDKCLLLVLDNFEHLLGAGPTLAGLLPACTGLRLLATSREALRLSGEQEYPITPLPLPAPELAANPRLLTQNAAVALFTARTGGEPAVCAHT